MDRIEFVVADDLSLPRTVLDTVEPMINGESLVDMVERLETDGGYAGLLPDYFFEHHRDEEPWVIRHVLGCSCGDPKCSWVSVEVKVEDDEVVWNNLLSSRTARGSHLDLGPFRFDRTAYMESLYAPTVRAAHPRRHDN